MLIEPKCCVFCTMKAAVHAAERASSHATSQPTAMLLSMLTDLCYRLDRLNDLGESDLRAWQRHFERCLREEGRDCWHQGQRDAPVDKPLDPDDRPF